MRKNCASSLGLTTHFVLSILAGGFLCRASRGNDRLHGTCSARYSAMPPSQMGAPFANLAGVPKHRDRRAIVTKRVRLYEPAPAIPAEILSLFGDPPVLSTEDP